MGAEGGLTVSGENIHQVPSAQAGLACGWTPANTQVKT